jgi:hypothetical protein
MSYHIHMWPIIIYGFSAKNYYIYTESFEKTGVNPVLFDPKLLCKILLMQSPLAKVN